MGATTFTTLVTADTVDLAFREAGDAARHEYGHSGCTGTIADKHAFRMVHSTPPLSLAAAHGRADALLDNDRSWIADKWGPAGAIAVQPGPDGKKRWLFFGWAPE